MKKVNFKNSIYVDFDKVVDISNFNSCSEVEKRYYKKYNLGNIEISYNNCSFIIECEDLFYIYNDLFLKSFKFFFSLKDVKGTYMAKEHFGIIITKKNEGIIKLKEFFFNFDPTAVDKITQEIEIPKSRFLLALYKNILSFNKFYSKVFHIDLSFWEKYVDEAHELLKDRSLL